MARTKSKQKRKRLLIRRKWRQRQKKARAINFPQTPLTQEITSGQEKG